MPCYSFQGIRPVVDPSSFVHPTASLIGDVIVGPGCYLGPGASLRGDFGRIVVEGDTSIQDNCTVHTASNRDVLVGRGATIGHNAVLHCCTVGRHTLVGMGAVVLDDATVGDECLIGALSLVKTGAEIPDRSLVAGNPAKVISTFGPDDITWRADGNGAYQRLAAACLTDLVECPPLPAPEPDRRRVESDALSVRLNGPIADQRRDRRP